MLSAKQTTLYLLFIYSWSCVGSDIIGKSSSVYVLPPGSLEFLLLTETPMTYGSGLHRKLYITYVFYDLFLLISTLNFIFSSSQVTKYSVDILLYDSTLPNFHNLSFTYTKLICHLLHIYLFNKIWGLDDTWKKSDNKS